METTKNHAFVLKQAGIEHLDEEDLDLPQPDADDKVLVRLLFSGVGFTDKIIMDGNYIYAKPPCTPGYEWVGEIVQEAKTNARLRKGQRVACLAVTGGWQQYVLAHEEDLVAVPDGLDLSKAVALILNYATAYQMLTREALHHNPNGRTALFTGISGGVGLAFLDLLRARKDEKWTVYGTASVSKHAKLKQLYEGVIPIDYTTEDVAAVIREREKDGVDFVFDGLGGSWSNMGWQLLKRHGKLITFGVTSATSALGGFAGFLLPNLLNLLSGASATFYGITKLYKHDKKPFLEDLPVLLEMLKRGEIDPIVDSVYPLRQCKQAIEKMIASKAVGKIVIDCQN